MGPGADVIGGGQTAAQLVEEVDVQHRPSPPRPSAESTDAAPVPKIRPPDGTRRRSHGSDDGVGRRRSALKGERGRHREGAHRGIALGRARRGLFAVIGLFEPSWSPPPPLALRPAPVPTPDPGPDRPRHHPQQGHRAAQTARRTANRSGWPPDRRSTRGTDGGHNPSAMRGRTLRRSSSGGDECCPACGQCPTCQGWSGL